MLAGICQRQLFRSRSEEEGLHSPPRDPGHPGPGACSLRGRRYRLHLQQAPLQLPDLCLPLPRSVLRSPQGRVALFCFSLAPAHCGLGRRTGQCDVRAKSADVDNRPRKDPGTRSSGGGGVTLTVTVLGPLGRLAESLRFQGPPAQS